MTLAEEFNLPEDGFLKFINHHDDLIRRVEQFEERRLQMALVGEHLDIPEDLKKELESINPLALFV